MKKIILLLFLVLIPGISQAACDDPLTDGVDYTNCRFSDGQDLQGAICLTQIYHLQALYKLILIKVL